MSLRTTVWTVATIALGAAIVVGNLWWQKRTAPPLQRLMDAASRIDGRPIRPWVSGFTHRKYLQPGQQAFFLPLHRAASEVLTATAAFRRDAEKQHAAGIALLYLNRPPDAVGHLEQSTRLSPNTARFWSDLAAARLEAAGAGSPLPLMEALTAADRALALDRGLAAAHFNRALILRELHLHTAAARSARACLRAAPISGWDTEARQSSAPVVIPRAERWQKERSKLDGAVRRRDSQAIREIVRHFHQEARAWSELIFLGAWATGDTAHCHGEPDPLTLAREVGAELRRSTGESLLAEAVDAIDRSSEVVTLREAHQTYGTARKLYRDRRITEALPLFDRAIVLFRQGGSPMAHIAQYYTASCLHDAGRNAEALALIDGLLERLPQRYMALRGQLLWERGTVLTRTGRLTDALRAHRDAMDIFLALGETNSATYMINSTAVALSFLGRRYEAWDMRRDLFRRVGESGDAMLFQTVVDSTARSEALAQHWPEAYSLLTLSVEPEARTNARVTATSLVWRALAADRIGLDTSAGNVDEARRVAAEIADPVSRGSTLHEIAFADGVLSLTRAPDKAHTLLSRYIDAGTRRADAYLLPEAFLARALARKRAANVSGAIEDLEDAQAWIERRRNAAHDEYREAFFSTDDAARRELVSIHHQRGDPWHSLIAAEQRSSPRTLRLDRTNALSTIPDGALVVRYVVLPRQILIFALTSRSFETAAVTVPAETLTGTITGVTRAIISDRPVDGERLNRLLAQWLLAPIHSRLAGARQLYIIADDALADVPFAALPYGKRGAPLVESIELVFKTQVFADRVPPRDALSLESVLTVGDPSFDITIFPSLGRLTRAREEALTIARGYADREILIGANATTPAVLQALQRVTVAHFAVHAEVVANAPSRSFLILAGSGAGAGTLNVDEITRLRFRKLNVVVLAGCRTASATSGGGSATGIAVAFRRAGARNVVGNLWDMEDRIAYSFSIAFHRRLREGVTPSTALRQTQIEMMRSSDPALRAMRSWGGLRVYGE